MIPLFLGDSRTTGGVSRPITTIWPEGVGHRDDELAQEEPLEIVIAHGPDGRRVKRTISITMRTPGEEEALAVGFLLAEGLLRDPEQVREVVRCGVIQPGGHQNIVRVELRPEVAVDWESLNRHVTTNSSCGLCGKTSMESLRPHLPPRTGRRFAKLPIGHILNFPKELRARQGVFDRTGGLHAAGLMDRAGVWRDLSEDVGRHNAVDKLIGKQFLAGNYPMDDAVLLLSGRAGFELVQKAVTAGIEIVAAVGAPSSLAVDLAVEFGVTLIGFVREGRCNVYHDAGRLDLAGCA